jgi:hypothetical protein
MAEFDNASEIGPFAAAPSEIQAEDIGRYDKALGSAGREQHARRPASYECIDIPLQAQVPSGGSAEAVQVRMPYPFRVLAIDGGAEEFGGSLSALTYDVEVDDGGGFATILDAPTDVFAGGAGVPGRSAPEDGSQDLAFDDLVKVTWAATGDVADGAHVRLWGKRL